MDIDQKRNNLANMDFSVTFMSDEEILRLWETHCNSQKDLEIWDILTEVVKILNQSKYSPYIIFRGAYVLVTILRNSGYNTNRFTEDVDMDWLDNSMWREFYDELPDLLTQNSKLGIKYSYSERSRGFSSEKMKLILDAEISKDRIENFSLDLSQRDTISTIECELDDSVFNVGDLYVTLCDKLHVFCTHRVGARIKDFYDLYLISFYPKLYMEPFIEVWNKTGFTIPYVIFGISPSNFGRMRKAFNIHTEFRFDNMEFEDVMQRVLNFVTPILEVICYDEPHNGGYWDVEEEDWFYEG